jgi:hypothetical protein
MDKPGVHVRLLRPSTAGLQLDMHAANGRSDGIHPIFIIIVSKVPNLKWFGAKKRQAGTVLL